MKLWFDMWYKQWIFESFLEGKTRSYKPNRRGGRAHGGGGNRSDDRNQGSNFNQAAMRGQSTRGRGQSRGRGGLQNTNNASQSASNSTRRPDLGMCMISTLSFNWYCTYNQKWN